MMKVINSYGVEIDYVAAVQLMDWELREELAAEIAPCGAQEFFDEYCKRHAEKYGDDDFQPAQANPIW